MLLMDYLFNYTLNVKTNAIIMMKPCNVHVCFCNFLFIPCTVPQFTHSSSVMQSRYTRRCLGFEQTVPGLGPKRPELS